MYIKHQMGPMSSPTSCKQTLVLLMMMEWSTTAPLPMPLVPSAVPLSGLSMQVTVGVYCTRVPLLGFIEGLGLRGIE